MEVNLYGKTFRALADTGTSTNLVGSNVAKHLAALGFQPLRTPTTMKLADGSRCAAGDVYQLHGSIGGTFLTWEAHHVPKLSYELILGMELLEDLNLVRVDREVVELLTNDEVADSEVNALEALSHEENPRLPEFWPENYEVQRCERPNNVSGGRHSSPRPSDTHPAALLPTETGDAVHHRRRGGLDASIGGDRTLCQPVEFPWTVDSVNHREVTISHRYTLEDTAPHAA